MIPHVPTHRARLICVWVVVAVLSSTTAWTVAARGAAASGCDSSSATTAHRNCVLATAAKLLDGIAHAIAPSAVPLDPEVAVYTLGQQPHHAAGGAADERRVLQQSKVRRVAHAEWTIDGDVAFVAYQQFDKVGARQPSSYVASRITVRHGLIWEVMQDVQQGSVSGGGFPNTPVVAVTGPPATQPAQPDYGDASFCTDRIATHGDASMTAEQHRRCMIAIASTYVDAEENSTPGNQILFDPRFSRYSLGGRPDHEPSNSDLIRTQEGNNQGTYNRVIRQITDRQWTVDRDTVWIVYDGYLVVSTTHPGFHVAERFTIRNGLIWEIMIAPVQTAIP